MLDRGHNNLNARAPRGKPRVKSCPRKNKWMTRVKVFIIQVNKFDMKTATSFNNFQVGTC